MLTTAALVAACGNGGADDVSATPVDHATPRVALSYDGGIMVLDGTPNGHGPLDLVADLPTTDIAGADVPSGLVRLDPAGDDRHVAISAGPGFSMLDLGTWSDGAAHWTADPATTGIRFGAEEPGHVVPHAGRTALFDDGTGLVRVFDPAQLASGETPATTEYTTPSPHHGVAIPLDDGGLVVTDGTEDERHTVRALDADGHEIARTDDCPGVHGESLARGAIVLGCENGAVVFSGGTFTKLAAPDVYGRIGNHASDESSPVVLGDYKTDPDAELERPERISLVDTERGEIALVDLGTSYSFRSLARGPHGETVVLGTDGALHVVEPDTRAVTGVVPVIDAWTEPERWQAPRPAVFTIDHTTYVTDPARSMLHTVDLESARVTSSTPLPHVPNEISGTTG
ncbi:hypothetical protein HCA44_11120 [Rhodococcus sp. HNM0569]|nr:hypothetical protein [Rhodococcus sp. HNM0569]